MIIGIDPGLTGGICLLDESGVIVSYHKTPVKKDNGKTILDLKNITEIFITAGNVVNYIIEQQHSMPQQGISSTGKTMFNYGQLIGIIYSLAHENDYQSYSIINPQKWKNYYKKIYGESIKDKSASCALAQKLSGKTFILPRCKKPHDGICEAYLIAEYYRLTK